MIDYLKKRPMLLSALLACVICLCGLLSRTAVIISGIAVIFCVAVLLLSKENGKSVFCFIMLFILVLSYLNYYSEIEKADSFSGKTINGEFTVVTTPKVYDDYCSVVVEAGRGGKIRKGLKIFCFFEYEKLVCGEKIKAELKLESLQGSKYKLSNYSEGIFLSGNMTEIIKTGGNDAVLTAINKVKNYITKTLFSNLGYSEASTLAALVHGDDSYLTGEFSGKIKSAGVSHVMVVSGMHLAIIVSVFVVISQKFIYNRYLKALIIFLTVVFMTGLCGFSKSILRAGITYVLYAVSIILKRENNPENTLGAAVMLILISNPFTLFNIGFQLSVLSTFGILVIAFQIIENISHKNKLFYWFVSNVAISLSALLMTMPVTIYIFGYVSLIAVLTNILISEAVTAALSLAVLGLIVNLGLPLIAKPFFLCAGVLTKYINFVIMLLGSFKFSVLPLGNYAALFVMALIVAVLSTLLACKKRRDMIKLENIESKVIREGGGRLKWQ